MCVTITVPLLPAPLPLLICCVANNAAAVVAYAKQARATLHSAAFLAISASMRTSTGVRYTLTSLTAPTCITSRAVASIDTVAEVLAATV
jgi:hypothetical protein